MVLLLLGGCHVLDQTDLPPALGGARPAPEVPPAPPPPPPSGPRPLVTIVPGPDVDYLPALRVAVAAAQARKPDVVFEVASTAPATGPADAQIAAARAGAAAAAEVARAIAGLGVPDRRISLAARTDPDAKTPEIRVYVH